MSTLADQTAELDGVALAELVRGGQVSAAEVADAAIARIEALNPHLHAVIHPRFDAAREEARSAPSGALAGVPWLLKDLGAERAGEPLHEGIVEAREAGYRSTITSYTVEAWLGSGAIQVAKGAAGELGMGPLCEPSTDPPTRNPWDPTRSPGGSSGGSAAAVAARMVPVAHGNDAGGSIRVPASACGVVGLKPTRGRVPTGPSYGDVAGGLAVEGALTRTVRDTAAVLDVTRGWRPGSPYRLAPPVRPYVEEVTAMGAERHGQVRIVVLDRHPMGQLHPDCQEAVGHAASLLSELGHAVDGGYCDALDRLTLADALPLFLALGAWIAGDWQQRLGHPLDLERLDPLVRFQLEGGAQLPTSEFLLCRQRTQQATAELERWQDDEGVDVYLTATMPDPPGPIGGWTLERSMRTCGASVTANVTGQPAISVPLHWTSDGIPIGVELTARHGREDVLLALAAQLERAQPWAERRPPLTHDGWPTPAAPAP